MKALVVEDSKPVSMMIMHFLKKLGIEHEHAENGNVGLELLKNNGPFDLILVDWVMPEMDGIEFTRCVREDLNDKDVIMIMVTVKNSTDDVTTAMSAGINDYLIKPLNEDDLKNTLNCLGII